MRCLQFDGGHNVVVGTEAGKIKVLDLQSGKCVQTFEEHSRYVSCLQFDDDKVISGSPDGASKYRGQNALVHKSPSEQETEANC